jgi:hypothetical protein
MRQKSIFVGIAVLLAVMIMACDTGTGSSATGGNDPDDYPPPPSSSSDTAQQQARQNANALQKALADAVPEGVKVSRNDTTVTLSSSDTPKEVPVASGEDITVGKGATLAIGPGITIDVADGGGYGGEGTISIQAGGTLVDGNKRDGSNSYIFGNLVGTVEITAGGKFQVNGSNTDSAESRTLVGVAEDTTAFLKIASGSAGKVTLQSDGEDSTITIAGNVSLGSPTYGDDKRTLQLYGNETLVIAGGAILTLTKTGDDPGNLNSNEGAVVKIDGTLVIEAGVHLEALDIFTAGNSKGQIVVQPGGQIIQVSQDGTEESGKHLIVASDWTADHSGWTEQTLYQWAETPDPATAKVTIDFTAKTITYDDGALEAIEEGGITADALLGSDPAHGWIVKDPPSEEEED